MLRSVLRWLRQFTAKLHYTKNARYKDVRQVTKMDVKYLFLLFVLASGFCYGANFYKESHKYKIDSVSEVGIIIKTNGEKGCTFYEIEVPEYIDEWSFQELEVQIGDVEFSGPLRTIKDGNKYFAGLCIKGETAGKTTLKFLYGSSLDYITHEYAATLTK